MLKRIFRKVVRFAANHFWSCLWRFPVQFHFKSESEPAELQFSVLQSRPPEYLIINYHRVNPQAGKRLMIEAISPEVFAAEMEFLAENFCVISLPELEQRLSSRDLPPDCVCLTFDDGYRDNYQYAFPILQRMNLSATIFLVTGAIGREPCFWFDRALYAIDGAQKESVEWAINGHARHWDLRTVKGKASFGDSVLRQLKTLPVEQREREIRRLEMVLDRNDVDGVEREVLNWDEVAEMAASGMHFGAHTHTHTILSVLSEPEAAEEIRKSQEVLEKKLGRECKWFAYPNGRLHDFSAEHKRQLQDAGFVGALTTIWGINTAATDRFAMARVPGYARSVDEFRLTLLQAKLRRS